MMKVIGLAGRAGSGKSAVARVLARNPGIEWVDLDAVAWDTYAKGTAVYAKLVEAFGKTILGESGVIDRKKLAELAFADRTSQETLDAIVHPAVSDSVVRLIDEARQRGVEILLVEGALLASSPHVDRSLYDRILWFEATDEVRSHRLEATGRGHHTTRGRDVFPPGEVTIICAEGPVEAVADRVLQAIRAE
jgi:dephospho-CoA kinase